MTVVVSAPSLVLPRAVLADLELVLDGVLPTGRLLGGPVSEHDEDGPTRVALDPAAAAVAREAGSLLLVDEEQTPLGRLVALRGSVGATGELLGELRRERRRESGAGRDVALDLTSAAPGATLVVLARPPLAEDTDRVAAARAAAGADGAPVLLVVPDHRADTAGVPTHVMLALAAAFGARLRQALPDVPVSVATAPLAWRGGDSDAALVTLLAGRLGATSSLVLAPTSRLDAYADAWQQVRAGLVSGDAGATAGLVPEDLTLLRRWRRPRSQSGLVVFLTGLSGSGKSTVARALHEKILAEGQRTVTLLDGDVVRQMLSSGLGFDRAGRTLNIRRIGFVAAEIARHGGIAICAPVAPYDAGRKEARAMAEEVGDFLLVHVSTPLEECERRDLKGLYAKARQGLIPEFTGISDPYEVPDDADLVIDTTDTPTEVAVARITHLLASGGWIEEHS